MTPEHEKLLSKKYPELLTGGSDVAIFSMDVGDGWYNIINGLCLAISNHVDVKNNIITDAIKWNEMVKRGEKPGWWSNRSDLPVKRKVPRKAKQPRMLQIKEKFGTIRVYLSHTDPMIDSFVYLAEVMSSITCEQCGAPAETHYDGGWAVTICHSCKAKREEERNEK